MKKLVRILAVILGVLAVALVAFLIWAYRPVPTFKQVAVDPRAPHYWPTDGWQYSSPEEQGMNSETLVEMMA